MGAGSSVETNKQQLEVKTAAATAESAEMPALSLSARPTHEQPPTATSASGGAQPSHFDTVETLSAYGDGPSESYAAVYGGSRRYPGSAIESTRSGNASAYLRPLFASEFVNSPAEKNKFPDVMVPADVAQQAIRSLRQLDLTPRLNLASFVTTWMEPECDELIKESLNVNYINFEEYPSIQDIKSRCVNMLCDLFHADKNSSPTGTDTVGSSEAILLAGLAMKRRWQEKRRAAGKSTERPNIVMGSETHVVWEKLANYFDLEPRWVNNRPGVYCAEPDDLVNACDENTIGVVAVLGTTYTGHFYDIAGLSTALAGACARNGWEIGIHVDGASGAFVAPFLYPDLVWDFKLPNVVSINASGHKFGLVYPGIGWVLFRSREYLPDSLIFHDSYLGGDQITFTLNFSKGASQVIAQYYQFMRLGRPGYTRMMEHMASTMKYLRAAIRKLEHFTILSNEISLPLVAISLKEEHRTHGYDEFDISDRVRAAGFMVPAYRCAKDNNEIKVMRILCREDFTEETADALIATFQRILHWMDTHFIYTKDKLCAIQKAHGTVSWNSSKIH